MSVEVLQVSQLTVVETLTGYAVTTSDKTVTFQESNVRSLNATSTPAASKYAYFQKALSSGAGTIDLTALPGLRSGDTVTGNGLKVRSVYLGNPSDNANDITIAVGVSSGYNLSGASFSLTLSPGQDVNIYLGDGAPVIGSGAKTLDLTGTGAQVLNVAIVMG